MWWARAPAFEHWCIQPFFPTLELGPFVAAFCLRDWRCAYHGPSGEDARRRRRLCGFIVLSASWGGGGETFRQSWGIAGTSRADARAGRPFGWAVVGQALAFRRALAPPSTTSLGAGGTASVVRFRRLASVCMRLASKLIACSEGEAALQGAERRTVRGLRFRRAFARLVVGERFSRA